MSINYPKYVGVQLIRCLEDTVALDHYFRYVPSGAAAATAADTALAFSISSDTRTTKLLLDNRKQL